MPIYEYQCNSCEHVFEDLQRVSDPAPEKCPSCSASEVQRRISNTSFHLKGGGWYVTDYKSPSSGSSVESANEASGGGGAGDAAPVAKETSSKGTSTATNTVDA